MALAPLTVDGYEFTGHDAPATIRHLGTWWSQLSAGRVRPPGFTALAAEQAALLAAAVDETPDGDTSLAALDRLSRHAFGAAQAGQLDPASVLGPSLQLLKRATAELRAAGAMPATATGTLVQISTSDGGVPKRAVTSATIERSGLAGDRQRSRQHHGRPWQAVCLWSAEVIDAFVADGHPIAYGACGENLTVRGLPWPEVRCGVRLGIGSVLMEASLFALPCKSNAQWFSDRDFNRMHHERGPVSRIYATVLQGGDVRVGDEVVLEP